VFQAHTYIKQLYALAFLRYNITAVFVSLRRHGNLFSTSIAHLASAINLLLLLLLLPSSYSCYCCHYTAVVIIVCYQYTTTAITATTTAAATANALAVEQLYLTVVQVMYSLYHVLYVLLFHLCY
jgi:hypothetical protein